MSPAGLRGAALLPALCAGCASPGAALPLGTRGRAGPGQGGAAGEGGGGRDSPRGLYELLGVSPGATQVQIKTAYYKQSFLYHPDRNAGSEEAAERFTRINEAYLVLGSVGLRKKYDRGLLSRGDLRTASKPSGKEGAAAPAGAAGVASSASRRTQAFTVGRPPGHPVFDFDKFYRAHYGEQLQRERILRERRQNREKDKAEINKRWLTEDFVGSLIFFTIVILMFSLK